jgi:hypothetical protein
LWSNDGSELYFFGRIATEPSVIRVTVSANDASVELGQPEPLFAITTPGPNGTTLVYRPGTNSAGAGFDILPDGRFVLLRSVIIERREIVLVQNWLDEARRLAPLP